MQTRIRDLDDAAAVDLLGRFAAPQARAGQVLAEWTPEVRDELADVFAPSDEGPVSDGDLARAALLVVAEQPENCETLRALLDGPRPKQMGAAVTITVVTAALIALQTRIEYEYKDGKHKLVIDKKAMKDSALVKLAAKLLGFGQ